VVSHHTFRAQRSAGSGAFRARAALESRAGAQGMGGSGSLPATEVPRNGAGPTPHGALENQRTKWWIFPLPKLDYRRVVI